MRRDIYIYCRLTRVSVILFRAAILSCDRCLDVGQKVTLSHKILCSRCCTAEIENICMILYVDENLVQRFGGN